ncbi:MAG TPA: PaaI family thioesterase, partial [Chloroflexi bacterium]|nr:PaaI family thioesterase [Chloroflexota bacterium]
MNQKAFQDYYPDDLSHCYGCGRLNEYGHQIKSYWDGEETVCTFLPEPYHTAIPGFVYGGLIASLIDCHSTATAAAAKYR